MTTNLTTWGMTVLLLGSIAAAQEVDKPDLGDTSDDLLDIIATTQPTRDQLRQLMEIIEKNGELWAEHRDAEMDRAAQQQVAALAYDEETFRTIKSLLQKYRRPQPQDLFVLNTFLAPLLKADPALIRQEADWVQRLAAALGRYRPYPTYTEAQLAMFRLDDATKYDPDQMLKVIERIRQLQARKIEADKKVGDYNELAARLNRISLRIAVRAAEKPREDEAIAKALLDYEKKKLSDWIVIARELRVLARWQIREYLDQSSPLLNPEAPSGPSRIRNFPTGITLLNLVNRMAAVCEEETLSVPTEAELQKRLADERRKKTKAGK